MRKKSDRYHVVDTSVGHQLPYRLGLRQGTLIGTQVHRVGKGLLTIFFVGEPLRKAATPFASMLRTCHQN